MFHYFRVWKKFGLEKKGENHVFLSKNFCLTRPNIFLGDAFCAVFQKFSGSEKFMDVRGGEDEDFLSFFYITVPKFSLGGSF